MSEEPIVVETAARLHFGPLAWRSEGPRFGGLGLMVQGDGLGFRVEAESADSWSVVADGPTVDRIKRLTKKLEAESVPPAGVRVDLPGDVAHRGLGSGTQLACAVVDAIHRMAGRRIDEVSKLAELTGRGRRSWLGLHGYVGGGLMLDAGQTEGVGVLASRVSCPGVLLLSLGGNEGLSGRREEAAFADLPAMPIETTGRLCDLAVRHVIAGAAGGNFRLFADGLTEYGLIAGEFFKTAQGGRFADASWEERLQRIRSHVTAAVAQSSWGPAVAVICEDIAAADRVRALTPEIEYIEAQPVRPFRGL